MNFMEHFAYILTSAGLNFPTQYSHYVMSQMLDLPVEKLDICTLKDILIFMLFIFFGGEFYHFF